MGRSYHGGGVPMEAELLMATSSWTEAFKLRNGQEEIQNIYA